MKVLSLFSGVGGFDMGLENAGMQTVFQCEWDKHANTILHKHWPTIPKWEDVSTLTGKHILANAPVIDVVAWGSPCQDLSVAGKRAGLEGGRSNLFHEGIRIIKELRKETNGQYPRISIWENVVGALNSNRGADFGIIIDEMAEAGAMVIEWAVLDAQYFGVPQRRRRVFVIAIFDPVLANICPDPLLPVSESLPGHLTKGKSKRQSASRTLTEGIRTDGAIVNSICGETYHHGGITNQDLSSGHMVVDSLGADGQWAAGTSPDGDFLTTSVTSKWSKGYGGPSGSEYYNMVVGALAARDYKGVGNQYVAENKCVVEPVAYHFDSLSSNSMKSSNPDSGVNEVDQARTLDTWRPDPSLNQGGLAIVEPFVKSSRAQTSDDSETWISSEVNPTLNSFDQGDVRTTTAIVGSLQARDFKGVNHEGARDGKLIIEEPLLFENSYRDGARIANDGVTQTLTSKMGTGGGNTPMIAIPIQDGREIEKNQNGLGIAEVGAPAYTIDSTGSQAVAYGIQGTMIGRQDHNGPGGQGITQPNGAMYTLTRTDVHAIATTMAVRRLTPLECERLMGWPDDHTRYKADGTEQTDGHRYKQCGNGVASPVAQWIGKHLLKLEGKEPAQ